MSVSQIHSPVLTGGMAFHYLKSNYFIYLVKNFGHFPTFFV